MGDSLQMAKSRADFARWTPRTNGRHPPNTLEAKQRQAELSQRIAVLEAENQTLKAKLSTAEAMPSTPVEDEPFIPPPDEPAIRRRPTLSQITRMVARAFHTTETDLFSERRDGPIIMPRHIAIYLCRRLTLHSLPRIGQHFGGRDHTTIMSACEKIAALRHTDENLRAQLAAFETRLFSEDAT